MKETFRLYSVNPKLNNLKDAKAEDIVHIYNGTEIKFTSGPYNGLLATIVNLDKVSNTNDPSKKYMIEVIIYDKINFTTSIPLYKYSIEFQQFASQIYSPQILIPDYNLFKEEFRSIREVNDKIIYEITKNPKYLDFLHPEGFEDLVSKIYGNFGFEVKRVGRWNQADKGVDIIGVNRNTSVGDFKIVLQCKHTKNKIQPSIIRELNGILDTQNALKGIVVTSNYFTKNTLKEAHNDFYRIELKDRDFLINSLDNFFK
ncbi:restriction endonuclease [Flavobacterium sp. UBA6135]|uniref:restriction endonuclease n=1 Tax=Flavobacterium sp. UBA6135 TaxID=1946553 RepID=UPI0025C411AA|nr:restriction endonuclease [Flavobacterium sp. UBA6135]